MGLDTKIKKLKVLFLIFKEVIYGKLY